MNTNGEQVTLSKKTVILLIALISAVTIIVIVVIFTLIHTHRRDVNSLLDEQAERESQIIQQQRVMTNMQEQMDVLSANHTTVIDQMTVEIDELQYTIEELIVNLPLEITTESVLSTVQQAAELTTLVYEYTDVSILDESNFWTRRLLIIRYTGRIRAGIDFEQIMVDVQGYTINITMPPARIISHELPFETIEVVRDETGIFTPSNTIPDFVVMMAELQLSKEADILAAGILNDARINAQDTVRQMIHAMIITQRGNPADYTIVFR